MSPRVSMPLSCSFIVPNYALVLLCYFNGLGVRAYSYFVSSWIAIIIWCFLNSLFILKVQTINFILILVVLIVVKK